MDFVILFILISYATAFFVGHKRNSFFNGNLILKDVTENRQHWSYPLNQTVDELESTCTPDKRLKERDEIILNRTCIRAENVFKLDKALVAQKQFLELDQYDADRIFTAVAQAANMQRLPLAKMAFIETQMGCMEDKVLKNGLACELIMDRYLDAKTCGLIDDDIHHGIKTYAYPVGPICCLTPVTNPTSTAIAKCLMMAKTRNAGIVLPHPRASNSTCEAVRICCEAGEKAGAPKNWVQFVDHPSMEESNAIMKSDEIRLILSTGGPGVVKASYTSGKPAIGVGSGNAPVLVDETANLNLTCGSLVMGKTFDNGMICAAEQSVVVHRDVYDNLKELLVARGVHFLKGSDREKLANYIRKRGKINPDIVGQSAIEIACRAGIDINGIPNDAVILGTEETEIGDEYPLSHEKLSPVLSLYVCIDFEDGLDLCERLARNGGKDIFTKINETFSYQFDHKVLVILLASILTPIESQSKAVNVKPCL